MNIINKNVMTVGFVLSGILSMVALSACNKREYQRGMQQCMSYCERAYSDNRGVQKCQAQCNAAAAQMAPSAAVQTASYGAYVNNRYNEGGSKNESNARNNTASLHSFSSYV